MSHNINVSSLSAFFSMLYLLAKNFSSVCFSLLYKLSPVISLILNALTVYLLLLPTYQYNMLTSASSSTMDLGVKPLLPGWTLKECLAWKAKVILALNVKNGAIKGGSFLDLLEGKSTSRSILQPPIPEHEKLFAGTDMKDWSADQMRTYEFLYRLYKDQLDSYVKLQEVIRQEKTFARTGVSLLKQCFDVSLEPQIRDMDSMEKLWQFALSLFPTPVQVQRDIATYHSEFQAYVIDPTSAFEHPTVLLSKLLEYQRLFASTSFAILDSRVRAEFFTIMYANPEYQAMGATIRIQKGIDPLSGRDAIGEETYTLQGLCDNFLLVYSGPSGSSSGVNAFSAKSSSTKSSKVNSIKRGNDSKVTSRACHYCLDATHWANTCPARMADAEAGKLQPYKAGRLAGQVAGPQAAQAATSSYLPVRTTRGQAAGVVHGLSSKVIDESASTNSSSSSCGGGAGTGGHGSIPAGIDSDDNEVYRSLFTKYQTKSQELESKLATTTKELELQRQQVTSNGVTASSSSTSTTSVTGMTPGSVSEGVDTTGVNAPTGLLASSSSISATEGTMATGSDSMGEDTKGLTSPVFDSTSSLVDYSWFEFFFRWCLTLGIWCVRLLLFLFFMGVAIVMVIGPSKAQSLF